ncbi:hypothetical protein [Streptomyces sp. NPDC093094]|uniref:hypothetical protein n=1 Tax=Streptomyces sp. NPDC093094 TaxID=3366026 RepID=UPI003808BDF0
MVSETTVETTDVTSQYSAQVTGDLERNIKEQERISGEVESLQAQLAALQRDQAILVSVQQALGIPSAPAVPAPEPAKTVPAPRKKAAAASRAAGPAKARKAAAAPAKKRTAGKSTANKSTAKTPEAQPAPAKLVDIVREHLVAQKEPRSATEIATALGQQQPERSFKTTVVRSTLEGLVARNQAQRTKQGTSVFYVAPGAAAEPPAEAEDTAPTA